VELSSNSKAIPQLSVPEQEIDRYSINGWLAKVLYTIAVVGPLVALAYAIKQLWQHQVYAIDIALLVGMYMFTATGITVGFHRYLTHRAFKTRNWLKILLLAMGSMAIEGPALTWASTHLEHHARADKDGDPHSPIEGFFHAHVGWIIDGFRPNSNKYGDWLREDRIVMFITRTFWFWVFLTFFIPYLVDGWRGVLWGGLVRVALVHHVTWSVNSVCHVFGKRPFKTGDRSTNNWLVGLLAGGEGWHNNHHAFQRSAFHGLYWWQLDLSGLFIRFLEIFKVVDEVQRVSPELIRKRLRESAAAVTGQNSRPATE